MHAREEVILNGGLFENCSLQKKMYAPGCVINLKFNYHNIAIYILVVGIKEIISFVCLVSLSDMWVANKYLSA